MRILGQQCSTHAPELLTDSGFQVQTIMGSEGELAAIITNSVLQSLPISVLLVVCALKIMQRYCTSRGRPLASPPALSTAIPLQASLSPPPSSTPIEPGSSNDWSPMTSIRPQNQGQTCFGSSNQRSNGLKLCAMLVASLPCLRTTSAPTLSLARPPSESPRTQSLASPDSRILACGSSIVGLLAGSFTRQWAARVVTKASVRTASEL